MIDSIIYDEYGFYRSPDVYDDLPDGIRVVNDALYKGSLDVKTQRDAVRWLNEARDLYFMVGAGPV